MDTAGDAEVLIILRTYRITCCCAVVLLLMSGHADCAVGVYYGECLPSVLAGAVWPPRARSYCRLGLGGPGHAAQGALHWPSWVQT